ncbi:MAG: zinc ribbon domain-containing protein [Ignavibacteriales bacterium]|nr:zinc ribbon domain-containing protein [Ignavibacteriales bacterium]
MVSKKCLECNQILPANTRFCPNCGQAIKSIEGFLNIFENVNDIHSIQVTQNKKYLRVLPGLSGFNSILCIPDSNQNYYRLFDSGKGNYELGRTDFLPSEISKSSTPVFDGLFLNTICSNILLRFGVDRNENIISNVYIYHTAGQISSVAISPTIVFEKDKRFLLFIVENKLFIIDLSRFKEESSNQINLVRLQSNRKWNSIFYNFNKETIYISDSAGNVFEASLKSILGGEDSFTHIIKSDLIDIAIPVVMDNKIYIFGYNADKQVKMKIFDLTSRTDLPNRNIKENNIVIPCGRPIYSERGFLFKNGIEKGSFCKILKDGNSELITLSYELNTEFNFVKNNIIYSVSRNDRAIRRLNMASNQFISEIPVNFVMSEVVNPLSNIFYLNGLLAFIEHKKIILVRDI